MPQEITEISSISSAIDSPELSLFDPHLVKSITGVRVFDVGQGDCIGLLDQDAQVFCYIDYGGLNDHPDADSPSATASRMPIEYAGSHVSIVLTHWDKDHYWSANKKNPIAQECEWLVPRQMVSPQAVFFAARLSKAKCWPESRRARVFRFRIGDRWNIGIRKCAPFSRKKRNEDRNGTGLAITLVELVRYDWATENFARFILLPGDAPFQKIPNLPSASLYGLIAYHHGARTHWTKKTKPQISTIHPMGRMVYSHGENEYGHPYRKNYQPDWDAKSITTAEVRGQGKLFVDIRWDE